jgi:transcriptional regulator GlxA family with amidase domain
VIVRHTRKQLARHYVRHTTLGYPEISFLIGFKGPSSFIRAFREWTGEAPETVRLAAGS